MSGLQELLKEGADAYQSGSSQDRNPYSHGTAAYWNWLEGWEQDSKFDEEEGDWSC